MDFLNPLRSGEAGELLRGGGVGAGRFGKWEDLAGGAGASPSGGEPLLLILPSAGGQQGGGGGGEEDCGRLAGGGPLGGLIWATLGMSGPNR